MILGDYLRDISHSEKESILDKFKYNMYIKIRFRKTPDSNYTYIDQLGVVKDVTREYLEVPGIPDIDTYYFTGKPEGASSCYIILAHDRVTGVQQINDALLDVLTKLEYYDCYYYIRAYWNILDDC